MSVPVKSQFLRLVNPGSVQNKQHLAAQPNQIRVDHAPLGILPNAAGHCPLDPLLIMQLWGSR
jgi:hypothetical protein